MIIARSTRHMYEPEFRDTVAFKNEDGVDVFFSQVIVVYGPDDLQ